MLEQDDFVHLVREALAHLHDLPYLEASPLRQLLSITGEESDGALVRRRLLQAIEQLKPVGSGPAAEMSMRHYRCVFLRYVEGLSPEQVQEELQVSGRQMRRDNLAGLESVAALLWPHYARRHRPGAPAQGAPLSETELLETELARVGSAPAEGSLNVEQTVLEVIETVTRLADSRGTRIRLALPTQLPPVVMDPVALRQVLLNLLTFALDDGSGRDLEVGGSGNSESVELRITIRPIQLTSDLLADHRLRISERLVALQGGTLHLASGQPDELVASINLPAASPTTVLVVDDNPDIGRLFQRYLWAGGYQMLQATTGAQALQLAMEVKPRVITLDVMMPSQDGWQVLRRLQDEPSTRGIPVIVCSVLHERDLAFSLGAADFLAKPVTQQVLLAALERCLSPAVRALQAPEPRGPSSGTWSARASRGHRNA